MTSPQIVLTTVQNNKTHQENPFLREKARRDSPVVSWTEQEILSSAQAEQEPTHWSTPHSQKSLKVQGNITQHNTTYQ